ncbi:MAG: ATP-binding protein [Alphaproteobacteria bacterium]|nr:ATP-binding protein [Alphaproteobacteria bacterium]
MVKNTQYTFDFAPHPYFGREDFMVAKCNYEAVKIIDAWPQWPFFAICLYGPSGCGKTHLSRIFADNVSKQTNYPYHIPYLKAQNIKMDSVYDSFEKHKCLVIEDLNNNIDEEALFHLYNLYRNENGFILLTSEQAPARWHFKLPDLQSRLNIVPSVAIGEPDDEMLSALIVKLFADRQLIITPDLISYMVKNMQRSFSFCNRLVAEIDTISLIRKRAVSLPIIKEALANLNETIQGELF